MFNVCWSLGVVTSLSVYGCCLLRGSLRAVLFCCCVLCDVCRMVFAVWCLLRVAASFVVCCLLGRCGLLLVVCVLSV